MFKGFCLALLLLTLGATRTALAADLTGVPKILAANHVSIGSTHIRLLGIDAPSLQQLCLDAKGATWKCGVTARDELIRQAGGRSWTCRGGPTDRRGRVVAKCDVDGQDIQQWLVRQGWALAAPHQPQLYQDDQKQAQAANAGLWQGAFFAPADWRVRRKQALVLGAFKPKENVRRILFASASGPLPPSPACRIKGNVNTSGQCIYHRPTSRWYAQIRMKISKGTRWFCSVEEAEAAGCRETRR